LQIEFKGYPILGQYPIKEIAVNKIIISDGVDTRYLKSGKYRLRFKLSLESISIVHKAVRLAEGNYKHVCLDHICLDYYDRKPIINKQLPVSKGRERFSVTLFRDQYEIVALALDSAIVVVNSDAAALTLICMSFLDNRKGSV